MKATKVTSSVYWVGAKDWNVRDFHGYKTHRGTTYNAYLVMGEKIVLVDTVKESFVDEMLERIKSVVDPAKIDYVVSNHVEMDHSGGIPEVLKVAKNAQLVTSAVGAKGLKQHYDTSEWNFKVVKPKESLDIGQKTLQFVPIPFVHWPDSMVTYIPEEKLLLPNDACGQHLACEYLFDDEAPIDIVFDEMKKYYANIVYPFGVQVNKTLDLISSLDIEIVAPSHGVIWRKYIPKVIEFYQKWANYEFDEKAVIIYDSMWGSTEKMAKKIQFAFEEQNIPVVMRCLKHTHISDIMNDIISCKYIAIGSPTLNDNVLPSVGALLTYMKGLRPRNKVGFVFGSFGWNSKSFKDIENTMKELEWKIPQETVISKFIPTDEIANKLKESIVSLI